MSAGISQSVGRGLLRCQPITSRRPIGGFNPLKQPRFWRNSLTILWATRLITRGILPTCLTTLSYSVGNLLDILGVSSIFSRDFLALPPPPPPPLLLPLLFGEILDDSLGSNIHRCTALGRCQHIFPEFQINARGSVLKPRAAPGVAGVHSSRGFLALPPGVNHRLEPVGAHSKNRPLAN